MNKIKKILRYFIYILIAVVIAMALIPYVFKDKIVEGVREAANSGVNAKVDFKDINLSLFRDFPNVSIRIEDIKVDGIDRFEDTPLIHADFIDMSINLPSLWSSNSQYEVNSIQLEKPLINVLMLSETVANYDIFPVSEESTESGADFLVQLKSYEISDATIILDQRPSNLFVKMEGFNHEGGGNMTADVYDLKTLTKIEALDVKMDGMSYIRKAATQLDATININMPESKYTLADNQLKINDLVFNAEGAVQLIGDAIDMDLNVNSPATEFKEFFSIIPYAYTKDYANIDSKGQANFTAKAKGLFDSVKGIYPSFDIDFGLANGYIKYPDLPLPVKDIQLKTKITNTSKDLSNMTVDIQTLEFDAAGNQMKGKALIKDLQGNTKIKGFAKGNIDLSQVSNAFPIDGVKSMSGLIDVDLKADLDKASIEKQQFNAEQLTGFAKVDQLKVESEGQAPIQVNQASLDINAKQALVKFNGVKTGDTDIDGDAKFENLDAYLVNAAPLKGVVNTQSKNIDLNAFIVEPTAGEATEPTAMDLSAYDITINSTADKIQYTTYNLSKVEVAGSLKDDNFKINKGLANFDNSDININGNVQGLSPYLSGDQDLKGSLNISSNTIDYKDFVVEVANTGETVNDEIIPVPNDLDMDINFNVKQLLYDGIVLTDASGLLKVNDETAELHNTSAKGLGGNMKFNGAYTTPGGKDPAFTFKYDLSQLKFTEAFKSLPSMQSFAPILKYIDGFFNSTLVMDGKLGGDMMPELKSINASGFIETINSSLKNFGVLEKLGNKLSIDDLKNVAIENTKNWLEIKDGKFELKPQEFKWKGIDAVINGSHGLDVEMDYKLVMQIPRELLKNNAIGAAADKGLSLLENEASKIGLNLSTGENIDVLVNIGGNITSPTFGIKPLGVSDGKGIKETVKDALKNKVDETKEIAKDSVKKVVFEAKETLKDTINKTVNTAIDSAKTVVNNKIDEAKEKAKEEAQKVIDSLAAKIVNDSIKNVLKDKVGDVLGGKTDEEVDKLKDKLKDFNPFKKKKN